MNSVAPARCIHSNHLFNAPFCPEQSLFKRIANAVFHIFTFRVPLSIYEICCFSSNLITGNPVRRDNSYFQVFAVDSVLSTYPVKPYTHAGQAALTFAREELARHPEITPFAFAAGWNNAQDTNQPINQEIALLYNLFWDVSFTRLEEAIKLNGENPWSQMSVLEAADDCMKIGYALSSLTLDDLQAFAEALATNKGEIRSYSQALTRQDSYQYRTYFCCTQAYHWIRGEIKWRVYPRNPDGGELNFSNEGPNESHAVRFYQNRTTQNEWNRLYNDFCDRVRLYVDENELQRADNRHFTWTKKDVGVSSFKKAPDSLPT